MIFTRHLSRTIDTFKPADLPLHSIPMFLFAEPSSDRVLPAGSGRRPGPALSSAGFVRAVCCMATCDASVWIHVGVSRGG
jgi:hypothetical protein